ncbi:MAG: IPT/TIG domain-containing protein [Bacteroidales bacterium]|nr:IPT/TIG domain-containing protein [Bacteroidales bacterium]
MGSTFGRSLIFCISVIAITGIFWSCSEDNDDLSVPTISAITPSEAEVGDEVKIAGTNFSYTPDENRVLFNGTAATVTASIPISITTTVPDGVIIGDGDVTVTVNGQISNSISFTVKKNPDVNSQTVYVTKNPYADVNWSTYGQYKGNYHTHTTNSDGSDSPYVVISEYYKKGYDILSITDHNYTTWPWPANPGMLAIRGNEYSGSHHMNAFVNFTATSSDLENGIPHVQSQEGILQINHPGRYNIPSLWMWYIPWFRDYSACITLEVFNQVDRYPNDRQIWDNINENLFPATGKLVWGSSNDDSHKNSHRFQHFQFMLMPELNEYAWLDCMKNGAFYFCNEPGKSGDANVPGISNISVDNNAKTITITASAYNSIEWIGPGTTVVATGNIFDYSNYKDKPFIRAVLYSSKGDSYTQPFGFETVTIDK